MPAIVRREVRRAITRERDAGNVFVDALALRRQLAETGAHTADLSEDILVRLIIEECANAAMPVILEPTDPADQIDAEP